MIQGNSLTIDSTDFIVGGGVLSQNQYLITVDPTTYTPGLFVKFTNCVFNVTGNILYTNLPIKMDFINCTFNVINTTTAIKLDYTSNGCDTST